MNSFSVYRSSIAALLILSIGWKIAVQPDDQRLPTHDIIDFLERNHFSVVVTDNVVNYMPIIRATIATCKLQIAQLTSDGSSQDLARHLAADLDRSFVVFRGNVYKAQPVLWTVLNYLWSRSLRELGLMTHITPVLGVASNSPCDAEQLPWNELQSVHR